VSSLGVPALVLAADHRARGLVTVEDYDEYLRVARAALTHCDGMLASLRPLVDLARDGDTAGRATYLSLNRTGLAGSAFELDDRLVTTVRRALAEGCSGVKVMVRIDPADPHTAAGLELVGRVVDEAHEAGLDAMVETLPWGAGTSRHHTDAVVHAAVVVNDMGAPLLKVPVPEEPPGAARAEAVARVVRSVGAPVLFLGGPRRRGDDGEQTAPGATASGAPTPDAALIALARDVMDGGGAGMAVGRGLLEHPDPEAMAQALAAVVHGQA
jgi:DhnA family fructose-bisphosphate aldolase class Ia